MDKLMIDANERNAALDLFRVLMMCGIVFLHINTTFGYDHPFPSNILRACVPGFAIISGYFGIKFKVSKIFRLYAVAAVCLLILALVNLIVGGASWRLQLGHWWFLHAYVIMMVFAPWIDAIFETQNVNKVVFSTLPFLFVVYIWGGGMNFNHIAPYLACPDGVSEYSFSSLLAAYIVGRFLYVFKIEKKVSKKAIVFLLLVVLCVVGSSRLYLAHYNNIVCQLEAALLFILFTKFRIEGRLAKVVDLVAPSCFSIYLTHLIVPMPSVGFQPRAFLAKCAGCVAGGGGQLMATLVVVGCCFVLDLPRRWIMRLPIFKEVCTAVDDCCSRCVNWLAEHVEGS